MTLETDLLLDRRRLKRRLNLWRGAAVAATAAAVLLAVQPRGVPGLGRRHVARLNVAGLITDDRKLVEAVGALADDAAVPALVVRIDSPGGSVGGGESLHAAIARVAARKPVVAVMGGTAASAGYMVALPAARIFAREATLTGSIGVLMQTGEVSGLLDRIGVSAETIVSGPLKDQPSFTHPTSPEGRQVLRGLVDDIYGMFVDMVAAGRRMDPARVRELADGRAYTGRQAKQLGLIDEFGGEPEARAWLAREKDVPEGLPIEDVTTGTWRDRTLGAAFQGAAQAVLGAGAAGGLSGGAPSAWAIWRPGLGGPAGRI